jgi:hypothetical protein
MQQTKIEANDGRRGSLIPFAVLVVILSGGVPGRAMAQQKGQQTFSSAEEASRALVAAAQANDEKAMLAVLGPDGKEIVSSGDNVQDRESHMNFARRFEEMHRLVKEPDGTTTLYIGTLNWPTPIPLLNKGNVWYFDSEMGKKEVLYRRVGRNEISTIRVCQELVAAQKEYYAEQHEYAQQIFSDEGQKNGLYWKAGDGQQQSPIGPLVAMAVTEGYRPENGGASRPYRGYLYHTLTSQGKPASGGAKSYLVNGKMSEGFAFVAYPAEYRSSGVMTFIVGSDGVVYQKDLGKKTLVKGITMKKYDPDSTWEKAEEVKETAAVQQKPQ